MAAAVGGLVLGVSRRASKKEPAKRNDPPKCPGAPPCPGANKPKK
jgi:hypothetical protein